MRLILAILLIFVASGCVRLPSLSSAAKTQPLTQDLVSYYDHSPQSWKNQIQSSEPEDGYQIHHLKLISEGSSPIREIVIDWYQPSSSGKLPAIIMSPILAGDDLYVQEFARFFAGRKMHALIVYRPKEVFSADRPLSDVEKHFRESIFILRHTLDWLEKEESVEPTQIGTFGISMGAILSTILTAVEPRIKASVLGLPAGDIPEIIMTSKDKAIRKRRRAFLEKRGWTTEQGLEELRKVMVSEPMKLAPAVERSKVLVIVGIFDRVLGFHRSMNLWRALGKPPLILIPTGHYTAVLATPYLKITTYSFLKRHLNTAGATHA